MKTLKLNATQNNVAQFLSSRNYPFTTLVYDALDDIGDIDEFDTLTEKEERLLLRYIGGDKKVKIEVV